MQLVSEQLNSSLSRPRGGRSGSSQLRRAQVISSEFDGLEKNTNRYDLLLLVKRVGKLGGFTPRMIQLLDYYMAFTRDCDWEEGGSGAIVYQSLTRTALDLGVSERQIQRLEKALADTGAITWNDSGNHRRYGSRCKVTGRILFGFGVDLTPLASLKNDLLEKLEEKRLYDAAWMETKRQISWYRAQLRGLLAEFWEEGASANANYEKIAIPIRTQESLNSLRTLLGTHKSLHSQLLKEIETEKPSCRKGYQSSKESSTGEQNVAHKQNTNKPPSNKLDTDCRPEANCIQEREPQGPTPGRNWSSVEPPENILIATGLNKITLKQVLNAGSERFRSRIPIPNRPMNANDLVEAAFLLKSELAISQKSWAEACQTVDRLGATVCLMLTDQAAQRRTDPVRKPSAYFRSLIRRAESRELNLQASVMALLKREEGAQT